MTLFPQCGQREYPTAFKVIIDIINATMQIFLLLDRLKPENTDEITPVTTKTNSTIAEAT
jgi:hypothetical protein